MTRSLVACVLLLTAGFTRADEPKPGTLTPKEISDGWIMLFDGETTFGWKTRAAQVKDGQLLVGGPAGGSITTTSQFAQGTVKLRYTLNGAGRGRLRWRGGEQVLEPAKRPVTIEFESGKLGTVPISIEVPDGSTAAFEFIRFHPLGTQSLFNGKDLSGWKVFADPKRMKTRFEVTPAGELSAKNGPGDLQTEKAFDNFVLQLECKTNGKWLNSGVFFRCMPNQYQNGYEAQIHNGYKASDRTKPVDFGTGAIYRRVPARKVVGNDNEWFTLTLVAEGKHIATWVNGYQTADWTDDRPANENPRQGFRAEKGHLSLQGHDPTTDLLFRNIRIAEFPIGRK